MENIALTTRNRYLIKKMPNKTINYLKILKHEKEILFMSTRNQRMETLRNNGVNVNQFFDVSLRVPLNAEVKIVVNGTTPAI